MVQKGYEKEQVHEASKNTTRGSKRLQVYEVRFCQIDVARKAKGHERLKCIDTNNVTNNAPFSIMVMGRMV